MADNPKNMAGQANPANNDNIRSYLAMFIVALSIGGIVLVGLCAILMAAAPAISGFLSNQNQAAQTVAVTQSFNNIKDILGILLPVMSAWAGTVLAYYFSKDNFETAARSTAALVQQLSSEEKLKSTVVRDVMIKIEDADKLVLEKDAAQIKLKEDILEDILEANRRERLPILDTEGRIKYMVHRSLIDKFIVKKAAEGKTVTELTLADLLADKTSEKMMSKSFCTIPSGQNLGYAKAEMEKVLNCSDIFITEDGTQNSRVIGWITDVIVSQQAFVK
jgi:hypothetical protein